MLTALIVLAVAVVVIGLAIYLTLDALVSVLEGEMSDAAGDETGKAADPQAETIARLEYRVKNLCESWSPLVDRVSDQGRRSEKAILELDKDHRALFGRVLALEHPTPQHAAMWLRAAADALDSDPREEA